MTSSPSADATSLDFHAGPIESRRPALDLAMAGAVVGAVLGTAALDRAGWIGLVVGAALGAVAGRWLGPRRLRLRVGPDGVEIGRLHGVERIPWDEVGGVGLVEGPVGRRGRTVSVAICRRGRSLPRTVPALTCHAGGFRLGEGPHPIDEVEAYKVGLLERVAPPFESRGVPVVAGDLDSWWDTRQP